MVQKWQHKNKGRSRKRERERKINKIQISFIIINIYMIASWNYPRAWIRTKIDNSTNPKNMGINFPLQSFASNRIWYKLKRNIIILIFFCIYNLKNSVTENEKNTKDYNRLNSIQLNGGNHRKGEEYLHGWLVKKAQSFSLEQLQLFLQLP